MGEALLWPRISNLSKTGPAFASVTWGASGASINKSLEFAIALQGKGIPTLMHITTFNTTPDEITDKLRKARAAGIQNLLVLRGDRIDPGLYPTPGVVTDTALNSSPHAFNHANELVSFIRNNFPGDFCIGVAAYPERHPESKDEAEDLKYLKNKVDSGADFLLTQFFFDANMYYSWVKRVRALGITQPIIPNVMVFRNTASFKKLLTLTKVQVPLALKNRLDAGMDDGEAQALGIKLSSELILSLISLRENPDDLSCVHLSTLNQETSVLQVLKSVGWVKPQVESSNKKYAHPEL